jgi:hypothetical protein
MGLGDGSFTSSKDEKSDTSTGGVLKFHISGVENAPKSFSSFSFSFLLVYLLAAFR